MTLDHDGKIRMDCSSPYAMASLVKLKDRFDLAFGNDPDSDRHGIVTRSMGLMNPNHFLAVAIRYLLTHRPGWRPDVGVGKTLVSSGLIDRVVAGLGRTPPRGPRRLQVVRAGAARRLALLRRRGERRGQLPAARRHRLDDRQGRPDHGPARRRDPGPDRQGPGRALPRADRAVRHAVLHADRRPGDPRAEGEARASSTRRPSRRRELAGEPIVAKLTRAPGNNAPIGGLKVVAGSGWFAARPSGTENIYKIYAESFRDEAHLEAIVAEAQKIVADALRLSAADSTMG